MAAGFLNRLIGIGAGLAVTGAVINSTLYNGTEWNPQSGGLPWSWLDDHVLGCTIRTCVKTILFSPHSRRRGEGRDIRQVQRRASHSLRRGHSLPHSLGPEANHLLHP